MLEKPGYIRNQETTISDDYDQFNFTYFFFFLLFNAHWIVSNVKKYVIVSNNPVRSDYSRRRRGFRRIRETRDDGVGPGAGRVPERRGGANGGKQYCRGGAVPAAVAATAEDRDGGRPRRGENGRALAFAAGASDRYRRT